MPFVRMRLTGRQADVDAVVTAVHGIDGVEHVEQIADLMPHMDDDDSSSSGLVDDTGADMHALEVETPSRERAEEVRERVDQLAAQYGFGVEFVDEF